MRLICPVSGTENEDRDECKQCGTDLRPLIQIAEFPDHSLHEGTQCLEKGQMAEAVERLSTAASLNPDSVDAQWKLAEAFVGLDQHKAAISHFDRALALAPHRAEIRSAREALAYAKEHAESAAALEKAKARRQRTLLRYVPVGTFLLGMVLFVGTQEAIRRSQPAPNWGLIVQNRLSANPVTRMLNLAVSTREGEVSIVGEVPTELQRELVIQIASRDVAARIDTGSLRITAPAPLETYRVIPGDSWWAISRRKYGTAIVWPEIEKANRRQDDSPLRLKPGERIVLPPVTIAPR